MKKYLLLAASAAALSLGACGKSTCPAYSAAKTGVAPVTASTAAPTTAQ